MTNIAIAHKDYQVRGGGERVVETLAKSLDVPLFIGGKDKNVELDYHDIREIKATSRQRWMADRGGTLRSLAYMAIWQNETRLTEYDTIITSGNEPLWYVPEPEQTVISYCHSPPRPLYDLNHNTGIGTLGALFRAAKRTIFQHNIPRTDVWIANSEHVKRRMERYWGVDDVTVIYPPVETGRFSPNQSQTSDFYLYLGRLAGHKRVETIIEAANEMHFPLKIAGRGPQADALQALAGNTVELLGYVSEGRKQELLSQAKALLFPAQQEDFGIVPIEAFAAGTPVIGANEGYTMCQIQQGQNGYLCQPTPTGFKRAIGRFETEGVNASTRAIAEDAAQYRVDRFLDEMNAVIEETVTTQQRPRMEAHNAN